MPLLKFDRGPWDGVQFDAPFAPDAVHVRDMQARFDKTGKPLVYKLSTAIRDHHVYLLRRGDEENGTWFGYEYVPDGKPYWDYSTED